MSEASFASLGPTLLARKGGAKPAMRPQLAPIPDASPANLEDLGWNDMGLDDDEQPQTADIVPITPKAAARVSASKTASTMAIRDQQAVLAERIVQDAAPVCESEICEPAPRRRASAQGKRAAFTLRLDSERHLKLRLAATMKDCSAQQLVTDALDALLADIDELDLLADKMKRK